LQPNPHPKLLGLVLQPDPLKPGSCKFNVVNNITDITLGLGVAVKFKTFWYNYVKDLTLLDLSFFYTKKQLTGQCN
jgi:hypothetical protein